MRSHRFVIDKHRQFPGGVEQVDFGVLDVTLVLPADIHELPAHHDSHMEAVGLPVEVSRGISKAQVQVMVDAVVESPQ